MNANKENVFDCINKFEDHIKDVVLSNQNLLKLIALPNDNPYDEPDIDNVSALVDDYIYFKPVAFENTVEDQKCFLLLNMTCIPIYNKSNYITLSVEFYIIVHNKLIKLEDGSNRMYKICSEIQNSLNEATGDWLGEIKFSDFRNSIVPTVYYGSTLKYKLTQFRW